MINRKRLYALGISTLLLFLVGCQKEVEQEVVIPSTPVKVIEVAELSRPIELIYTGVVIPDDQTDYSFKSTGRLATLNVEPGDKILKGDVLGSLDMSDLNLQLNAQKAQASAAYGDIVKSKESFNYASSQLDKTSALFESGGVSQDMLDQVELNYDVAKSSLDQARQAYNAAKANQKLTESLLEDTELIAYSSGTVLEVNYEVGELVPATQTVMTLRTETKTISVGLSQEDADVITKDTPVCIMNNDIEINGEISQLDAMPEASTRTYPVKIRSASKHLRLGSLVEVCFELGEKKGVWIPIQSILSDGEKFVYIIKDDRAFKRGIEVLNISGFQAEVKGLKAGEQMVVSGMKNLTDGVSIEIVQ